jgi:thymidylate kinase
MKSKRTASSPASPGLCIAFFGPDGIGKSAVIEAMKLAVRATFSSVVQFHFRPMFGRREDRPPVLDPHAQTPRSLLISSVKLIYWLLDCWYGYFIAIRPARRRSGLVIFDRYYPDILVDPARYRLPASSLRIASWLAALAPRPDLYVLLDAPAEVVQRRKHEVSLPESQRQRLAYLAVFESMPAKLLVDADAPVNQVAQRVSVALSTLQNFSMQRDEALLLADF